MYKNYKACPPEQTIQKIRNILSEIGIFMHESNFSHGDGLFNCRMSVNNDSLGALNIGQNGKGRTYEYSLASGYAEFMERIQNGIHFDITPYEKDLACIAEHIDDDEIKTMINNVLDFRKNKETMPFDKIWELYCDDIIQLVPGINTKESAKGFYSEYFDLDSIPVSEMYSIDKGETVKYPIELARVSIGTSGLCSGNTPLEAILHGFCEIFERHVALKIFKEKLTPPTIPIETFKNTNAYKTIKRLQDEYGIKVTVKDCSLGIGLPVIGILIVDPKNYTYNFKLGAEFAIEIALERCLTEVYQTMSDTCSFKSEKIKFTDQFESTKNQWYNALKKGVGQWPSCIFASEPSFPASSLNPAYGNDEKADLKTCIELCKRLNTKIYIRDNSFLGFPAFQIIAPNISGIIYDNENPPEKICYVKKLSKTSIYETGVPDEEVIAEFLEQKAKDALSNNSELEIKRLIPFYYNAQLATINPKYILALIAYMKSDVQKAYNYFCQMIEENQNAPMFYHTIAEYLYLKLQGMADKDITSILKNKYGRSMAMRVIATFSSPENILSMTNILYHFDFTEWAENSDSHLKEALCIVSRLDQRKAQWQPDHEMLAELFN